MTSIVCDTDDTARQCIPYLREQRHAPETFLPLNSLEVQPIKGNKFKTFQYNFYFRKSPFNH
jgi:chromosome segregation ATPase